MGVVSRRCVWLVVKRYIDILTIIINFPYSTCINSFLAAASLLLCSFLVSDSFPKMLINNKINVSVRAMCRVAAKKLLNKAL